MTPIAAVLTGPTRGLLLLSRRILLDRMLQSVNLALGGWAISLQRELSNDWQVDHLVTTLSFAHFLTDTEAGSTARRDLLSTPTTIRRS